MANNETRTVEDIEVKHVDPSPDSPDDEFLPLAPDPSSPKTETPAATSPAETKLGDQPAETPAPKEPVKPAEETKPAEVAPVTPAPAVEPDKEDVGLLAETLQKLSTEYKRLPSEPIREYALRLEVINTRRKLNDKKAQELLGSEPPKPQPAPATPVSDDVDPEDIADFSKKARAAGFVPIAEVQATTAKKDAERGFQTWINDHPEYDQVHDPEGILFEQVKNHWNGGMYITDPTKMKDPFNQTKAILDKIHQDVLGIKPTSDLVSVKAQQEKIKVASHTAASPGSSTSVSEDKTLSTKRALLTRGLKGFSDEEIEELAKD